MAEKSGSGPGSDYRELAKSFGGVAAEYDRARPSYPQELFDALERLAGRGLEGARVLDVGGTGISTRLLVEAAAPTWSRWSRARAWPRSSWPSSPGLGLVRGSGDELPFHEDSADFVTYAQAFHWTTPEKSVPEAIRVLRPGGALALWWNVKDSGVAWVRALGERLHAALPATYHGYRAVDEVTSHLAPYGLRTEHARLRWERRVSVDHVITDLTSRSYLAALTPEQRAPLLAVEREALLAEFPDGTVVEPYVLDLTVAVTPS